ncbi:hypothetical protein AMS68_006113 [Peltaster fructicola]|uniref:ATP-dependent Clp protease proteolytic subunit n=1 Tax=Peltaster fructicola TaxID=286661 RepID=A0A6H0Y0Z0_9PEZI|nr:hypothetical protein AMS68_006113 [Peltaster fructicola]
MLGFELANHFSGIWHRAGEAMQAERHGACHTRLCDYVLHLADLLIEQQYGYEIGARRVGFACRSTRTRLRHSSSFVPARLSADYRAPNGALPLPFVTEVTGNAWHTSDIFSRLLKERIICLNGEVDDTLSASIVAQLLFLEAENPARPISLYINSPGGSVTSGLAIYDTMQYIQAPVSTICIGQAASMGSLLLCGGAPGQRFCLPHSRIMVHQVSGGYHGQASDIAIHAKEILRMREQLNKIYKRHLTKNHTLEEIDKVMERDFFMDAQEAMEWGIVDKVYESRKQTTQA